MSTRRRSNQIARSLLALALIACSKDPQPSPSDIEQALNSSLPAFAELSSFSVEAMQNMGTQVEPAWQSRFRATIKVTSATFVSDGSDPGVVFARPVKQAGDKTEVFGKSVSTLYAGKWRTQLTFEGQPIAALGQPESAFGEKVIVRGSKDETAYLAERSERRRHEVLAAATEAEEQRRAEKRAREAPLRECFTPCTMYMGWGETIKAGGQPYLVKFHGKPWLSRGGSQADPFTLEEFAPGEAQFASPDGRSIRVQLFSAK